MNLDKIKRFEKNREYINAGKGQLPKEEEMIIIQEYEPKEDDLSNDIPKKINIKFGEKYELFKSKRKNKNIIYDFTYTTIESNKLHKIMLFKNVFYKILYQDECSVYLFTENNLKDNIYRNCLDGENIYFTVNTSNLYSLKIKTKIDQIINIENYISINFLCNDNVFMLNLDHKKEEFMINEMILKKIGIKVNRIEAVNGYNKEYDSLWNKISNTPFTNLEKKLGRKLIISRGSMGYLLSMEKIFSNVKNNYVCIFDDDILIKKDLSIEKITEILVNFSDFNILKFGSSQWIWNFDNENFHDNFYNSNELSNGSFACIYNPITVKNILQKIRNFNEPFDFSPLRQFIDNKSYVIYPNQIIANLSNISTITNKRRNNDYSRFRWDLNDYIKLPYIQNKKILKNNNNNPRKLHFIFGITTFKRISYLKDCINSIIPTLKKEHFFTIIISKGLDLLEKEDDDMEHFLLESFKNFTNITLILNYSYLHYIYYTTNIILKLSENIDYDFGFILNDNVLLNNNWYSEYYYSSKINKIDHLCWLLDTKTTIIDKNKKLKHNGSVLKANDVLITFTKNLIKNVGFFNETDFNEIRGHIEWSIRCCNKGYNNKDNFYDIIGSNKLLKLNTKENTSAISNTQFLDKVIHFADNT